MTARPARKLIKDLITNDTTESRTTRQDFFDRIDDLRTIGFFHHISARTGTHRAHGIDRLIVHRMHHHWQIRIDRL